MSGFSRELEDLAGLASEQGWVVAIGNKHAKWYPPDDAPNRPDSGFFTTSVTPSDGKIIRTIRNQFEKAGLITDRSQWKREKRRIVAEEVGEKQFVDFDKAGDSLTDKEIEEVILSADIEGRVSSPAMLAATVKAYREYQAFYKHCTCGKQFEEPVQLLVHLAAQHSKERYSHQPLHPSAWAELESRRTATSAPETAPETPAPSTLPATVNGPETGEKMPDMQSLVAALEQLTVDLEEMQTELNRLSFCAEKQRKAVTELLMKL